jgi:hypothetical protein
MCITVLLAPVARLRPWNATRQIITVPNTLRPERAVIAVRAVLRELAIPQPLCGAVCWCGEAILLPRISQHEVSSEVMAHGA